MATAAHVAKKFRGGHSLVRGGHGHPGPPPNGATACNDEYLYTLPRHDIRHRYIAQSGMDMPDWA